MMKWLSSGFYIRVVVPLEHHPPVYLLYTPLILPSVSLPMEDFLSSMWSSLSLSENEAISLEINPKKLSLPKNAIIGKLAMKKHVSLYEVDKGLKHIWEATKELESTRIGDNLYLFTFKSDRSMERVLENQPWNFRGSLVLLD